MKKYSIIMLVAIVSLSLTGVVTAADRGAIETQVNDIVVAINGGKQPTDFASAAQNKPYYVYIMEQSGLLVVHPSLTGKSLKEVAPPVYDAVAQGTPDGKWVKYQWQGAEKNAYVRKTSSGVYVGSGY